MAKMVATQVIHTPTGTIVKGQQVDSKAKIVKDAAPGLFVSAADYTAAHDPVVHRAVVEAATAAPGETRSVKKPAKKPAAKKKAAVK
jgi:hypothetical protein